MDLLNGLLRLLSLGNREDTPRRRTEVYSKSPFEIYAELTSAGAGQDSNRRQTYGRSEANSHSWDPIITASRGVPNENVRYLYRTVAQNQGTKGVNNANHHDLTGSSFGAEKYNSEFRRTHQQRSFSNNTKACPESTQVIVKQQLLGLYNDINMLSSTDFVKCITLSNSSREFLNIRRKFPQSLSIVEVQEVFNPFMKKSFELTRQFKYDNIRPVQLYHGTKLKHVQSICRNNFDWRLSGSERGHRIGHGVNFTSSALFAVNFCDREWARKVMILADVLVRRKSVGYGDPSNERKYACHFLDDVLK